ncbi:eukaryotic translation initiation factor 4 gamma 1 isoform X2 [Anoplophora glabripennis]|uniref:eukaryotic translation initiation factor 4 gamma 1 isoform X2 n=1 Tax=Anoplophora glabripennis TaxID=217634 RepID=UPI000873DFA1|nr:eukaryotic translation initiation factor 4 gamma 1 isoform X2 [Anoplophora glabripennis]
MVSRYVTNGPVKQEGICLLPPTHYRMMPPQRADGFPVSTPAGYVPQPNQGANQGPSMRGIAPNAIPPNQASTPPNADIKVQTISQPPSMSPMFVQPQVRSSQGTYFPRTAGPSSQTHRMPNHNNRPPQMYGAAQTQCVPLPTMYIPQTNAVQFYATQRPNFVPPSIPMYPNQHLQSFQYSTTPIQPAINYYYNQQMLPPRTGPIPQTQSATPNPTQAAIPNVSMVPNTPQHQPFQRHQNKRRPNAIAVIDPNTGTDRLNEIYEQSSSHPPSGESSARQTPQPTPQSHNKEVQAAFAKQVMQAINTDNESVHIDELSNHQEPAGDHIEQLTYQPPLQQAVQSSNARLDNIVQTSNLKVQAKEFVLPNSAKETPIVSANCDAVEVTLPNKSPKDRESPVKSRKQREQAVKEHKESAKEQHVPSKEVDKQPVVSKESEAKPKDVAIPMAATNLPQAPPPIKEATNQEKKSQKKESKVEPKAPAADSCESAPSVPLPVSSPVPPDASNNAKSKQNVQRVAQKQGLPQNNNQKPALTVVPQPQPAKANNKSHKKNELNMKGANKEGTDMDAFNDNTAEKEEVNANVNSNYINNDIVNANSITNNAAVAAKDVSVDGESNNKKIESNDTPTIKTEPVKPLKTKIDITDIVREKPKPIKPFTPVESHDETDRSATLTDKLVQAKNEANTKVSENNGNEKSLYKEGQFSPSNPDGKRVYHKELLMALRELPASRIKPDNIPDSVLADNRGRLSDGRASMGGRTDFMNPPFTNYGGKSSTQRGAPPKRNSQGKMGGSGQKSARPTVTLSISLREEVKLHETENAWRPARLHKGEAPPTDDDRRTEDLYKKVRGVLNKLTPQKFETLLSQIKSLHIETVERLQGVIDLVFEKAVDEPNFSIAYALMCKELALMQVPTIHNTEENPDFVNFRKLLITRCQVEFEKQSIDESVRNEKVKEIEECTDPEKKKDLQFDLEEYDRRLRMKSVGNIRFIGELFKQNMLTVNIMMRCLANLLDNKDEESLECLCKLLTTVGKELESKSNVNLSQIFNTMKNIVEKKDGKVSSRIRFMLQDVIDLRNSKWVPRRQDLNPKTIEQIQKEADNEQLNIQLMNSVPMTPRKEDRVGSGPNSDRKAGRGGRNVSSDDGWIVNTTNRNRTTQFTVQSDKLKSKAPLIDEPLGSSQLFGSWGKGSVGSNIKSQPPSLGANTANMYAALENMNLDDKRPISKYTSRPGNKDPYSSKGPSMERSYAKFDGRGSRSGSQHRSNDSSASSSQRSTPAPVMPPTAPPKLQPAQPAPAQQMTEEQMERRINNCLDEYVTGSSSVDDYFLDISPVIPPSYFPRMIEDSYLRVLEKSQQARLKTGSLFAQLVKRGRIQLEDYCAGLEGILSQADDLKIDIPKIWDYLAEILVDLICEEVLPLGRLYKSFKVLISQEHAARVLAPLFKQVVSEKGPNFMHSIWHASGLQLTDFMPSSQVDSFVKDNQFEFLVGGGAPVGQNQLSYEQIQMKLLDFLKAKKPLDDIVSWITANVGGRVKENQFIKALATAIFRDSINSHLKLVPETLSAHNNLLLKYVDNNSTYELQCLYALQALIHKLEHPQGLLLSICDKLYELGTFSQESFIAWENSSDPAEQEGKGVALKQLTCFFTQLKENDEEDYGSSTSDEA